MSDKEKTTSSRNMHAILLTVIGLILVVAGAAVATIHNRLRGSGLGTALIVVGVVLLVIAILRFASKRAK